MGETRVNLHHLLEDLRDAYPESLEETIVTEMVANALDSKATEIAFLPNRDGATLLTVDNGQGMTRESLRRYHDLATTTKQRGQGIGFAGVGIKLGLLACDEVLTETRRGKTHVATTWRMSSKKRAPWKWVDPPGYVTERGTAVRLTLANALSPLLDAHAIASMLYRHFAPLFDPAFAAALAPAYPHGVRFEVAGYTLPQPVSARGATPIAVRLPRRRKASAVGYMVRAGADGSRGGIAVSTLGKVIKRGWDWLGVSPTSPNDVSGMIEAPALAECLTLNKADFLRTGARGAVYLAHRSAMQKAVAGVLAQWGDGDNAEEEKRQRKTRRIERDIEDVLANLADEYPLLATLIERHRGGQKRLPMAAGGKGAFIPVEGAIGSSQASEPELRDAVVHATPEAPKPPDLATKPPGGSGRRRPARYSLTILFEHRPDDPALGRLVESTVYVNDAHPAYRRAVGAKSEPYHIAVTVAMALAPLAVEAEYVHGFVTEFLAKWGAGEVKTRKRRRQDDTTVSSTTHGENA
ncbi:MAG TPA: ATP-binding protein [Gemmatimonadales bacterium]